MAAVIAENRRELKAAEDFGVLPRTLENAGEHDFVALVEVGKRVVATETGGVEGRIVAVEVGGIVGGTTVGVVCEDREVVRKGLLQLE